MPNYPIRKYIICIFSLYYLPTNAQDTIINKIDSLNLENEKSKKISFKDSIDGKFDVSDFIITKKGFIPLPVIVTEPSLGGFGGGFVPIFIQPNKPKIVEGKAYPVAPNITAIGGGYTLNDTWFIGGARTGQIDKWGLKYAVGGGFANVNINYYFELDRLNKEVKMEFNNQVIPLLFSLTKPFKNPQFAVGLNYQFIISKLKINSNTDKVFIEEINDRIGEYMSGNIAKLGAKGVYDSRDNTFSPNKGIKTQVNATWSSPYVFSDYKFAIFKESFIWYQPILSNLINGFRFDFTQVAGDIPFYIKPAVNLRGVPAMRFQGNYVMQTELEERWDFTKRWSAVAFGGIGKGFNEFNQFDQKDWAYGYGIGGRYLIARKLNLRMGLDLAMGNDGGAFYIVFGSAWNR